MNRTHSCKEDTHASMMDAVGSRFSATPTPNNAPEACLVAGSKHYRDGREEASPQPPRMNVTRMKNSEAGHFPTQTELSDTLVVGLCLGSVRPLCPQPGPVVIIRATSFWDADGFVAGICAVRDGVFTRLGLVGLGVDIPDSGIEVTGGRGCDEAFDFRNAAVVVLFVFLVHSIITVCFVDCRVHC